MNDQNAFEQLEHLLRHKAFQELSKEEKNLVKQHCSEQEYEQMRGTCPLFETAVVEDAPDLDADPSLQAMLRNKIKVAPTKKARQGFLFGLPEVLFPSSWGVSTGLVTVVLVGLFYLPTNWQHRGSFDSFSQPSLLVDSFSFPTLDTCHVGIDSIIH